MIIFGLSSAISMICFAADIGVILAFQVILASLLLKSDEPLALDINP